MATHCSDEEGGSWYINSHGASILKKKRESLHFARNKSKKQMEKVAERHIDRQILSNQITHHCFVLASRLFINNNMRYAKNDLAWKFSVEYFDGTGLDVIPALI